NRARHSLCPFQFLGLWAEDQKEGHKAEEGRMRRQTDGSVSRGVSLREPRLHAKRRPGRSDPERSKYCHAITADGAARPLGMTRPCTPKPAARSSPEAATSKPRWASAGSSSSSRAPTPPARRRTASRATATTRRTP